MEFSTQTSLSLHQLKTPALAVGVFSDKKLSKAAEVIDQASNGAIQEVLKSEFKARPNTSITLRNLEGVQAKRVILIGLGKEADYDSATHAAAEQAFANYCVQASLNEAVSALASIDCPNTTISSRAQAAAMAAGQTSYRYTATLSKDNLQPESKLKKFSVWVSSDLESDATEGLRKGQAIANGMNLTRELGDLPGNICTPSYLGETAKSLAKEYSSIKAEVLDRKKIEALKMNAFLSVAKGSDEAPVFIVLRYTPPKAKQTEESKKQPIVLVGKGVTFDSGGISIKPGKSMDEMKYDMCGAASVLGTFRAIAEAEPTREIIGLIAACENLPSGKANKPGDVITSMSGKTIEILNTDAEGRLILCDALTYAERFKPEAVIDIATLTGACVVALGHVNSGLFSPDDTLANALLKAGRETNDPAWRLPLDKAYQKQLRSNFADIANIGGPAAGSITAACFLARFTQSYTWAHLDIAGTAWKSGDKKGATGRPVPLLVQYLLQQ